MNDPAPTNIPLRLKIIGPAGEEWYHDARDVPRVGDECTVWTANNNVAWRGVVESVSWGFAENFDGMFVIVQLAEPEDDDDDGG